VVVTLVSLAIQLRRGAYSIDEARSAGENTQC
jgi:hypothetical protein